MQQAHAYRPRPKKRGPIRGAWEWFTTPDVNQDGVLTGPERGVFIIARALLTVSLVFAAWGFGTHILGQFVVDAVGGWGLLIGFPIGGIVGAAASFIVAYGAFFAARAFLLQRGGLGVGISLGTGFCALLVFTAMAVLFSGFIDASWDKLEQAKAADASIVAAVKAGRDSKVIDAELETARADVTRALAEREEKLDWRRTLSACPSGQFCAEAQPIQRNLQVRDDGLVRGAGACATCGETMGAMAVVLDEAEKTLTAAQARRDQLVRDLDAIRSYESDIEGGAAADLAKASNVENLKTTVKLFIATARVSYQIQSWGMGEMHPALAQDDPTTEDVDESLPATAMLERRALNIGTVIALVGALSLDILNILMHSILGMLSTSGQRRRMPEEMQPERFALPEPGRGSVTDDGDVQVERTRRRNFTAADAAMQPDERPSAAAERLRRAREALQQPVRGLVVDAGPADDDLDLREAKALEAMARARRLAEIQKLEAEARAAEAEAEAAGLDVRQPRTRPRPVPQNGADDDVRSVTAAMNARRLEELRAKLRAKKVAWNTALAPKAKSDIEAEIAAVEAEIAQITAEQIRLGAA